jgi:molybdopterin converting factor small subunit
MRVTVSFYSWCKELTGCACLEQELPTGSTVDALLGGLIARFPKLAGVQRSILIAVGVDYQRRDYLLKDGDEVSLFPPVQGG